MKIKNKKVIYMLLMVVCTLLGYILWLSNRPVEIVDVHQRNNYSDVVVKNFPLTDKGKINWWLDNKERLKASYGIPKPAPWGNYTITFWLFGEGYQQEEKYDRLCFDDMNSSRRCIDKNKFFTVENGRGDEVLFSVADGVYRMKKNGDMIKERYE